MAVSSTINTDLSRFDELGYVHVPGLLDAPTIAHLRAILLKRFADQNTNVIADAVLSISDFADLLQQPKLRDALQGILGTPVIIPPHASAENHRFGVFHTDTTGAEMNGETFHQDPSFRMVTAAIYLQDNNKYGGGIRLVPGTHCEPDPYIGLTRDKAAFRAKFNRSPLRRAIKRLSRGRIFDWNRPFLDHPRQIDVPTRAGDLMIWDMRMIHRASPQKICQKMPEGGKIALFFTAGADNAITRKAYMAYVNALPENAFVRENRADPSRPLPAPTADYVVL